MPSAVGGAQKVGVAPVPEAPVLTGGVDPSGLLRSFKTTSDGTIIVSPTGASPEVQILGSDGLTLLDIAAVSSLTTASKGIATYDPVLSASLLTILGATTDAAVGDATGTINAHLRQIAKSLASGVAITAASGSIAAGAVAAGATSFVKLEDVASADADAGVPALAVRKASPANTSGTDGDYEFLQISAGRLWASANVDQINGVTPLMGAGNGGTGSLRVNVATDQVVLPVGGNVAHDGVDAGNPAKVGGIAKTAPPTAVSAEDRVNAMFDIYGKQIIREALREDLGNQATTISSSTSETTIVTADATYKLDLYCLILSNTSATATKVTLKDSTTGTTRGIFYVPAGDMRGFAVSPSGAHKQAASNNNWTATCGTSVATLEVTALFVRSL